MVLAPTPSLCVVFGKRRFVNDSPKYRLSDAHTAQCCLTLCHRWVERLIKICGQFDTVVPQCLEVFLLNCLSIALAEL